MLLAVEEVKHHVFDEFLHAVVLPVRNGSLPASSIVRDIVLEN